MAKQSGVFVLRPDNSLVPMQPEQFAKEDQFQLLLSRFPELLVGDLIDPESPRRWILIKREQVIATDEIGASQWSIDHLFLDQDGIPTLVEIKRQSDSRIRREVVGQMLDYAANCASYWSIEMLRASFEKTCESADRSSDIALKELIGDEQTPGDFWSRVRTNLDAGRIRLLFVADFIPVELKRVVEFLNRQMNLTEVLAVELRQFAGEGLRTIVPMVYGQTQEATQRRTGGSGVQRWDEQRLFEKLSATVGPAEADVGRRIYEWIRTSGAPVVFGTGRQNGSVYPQFRLQGANVSPVYLSTDGKLWLQFGSLTGKPVFDDIEKRRELMQRFGRVAGTSFGEADLARYPSIPLAVIARDPEGLPKVLSALDWMKGELRS